MATCRSQLRILRPPGDEDHDIFCKKKIEEKHVVKVFPYMLPSPDPHCFPPKSRKLINIRQRSKDKTSKEVARLLSPDLHLEDDDITPHDPFRSKIAKYIDDRRVDRQKQQAMTASPAMKYVFGPVDDPDAPLHAKATLGQDMSLWQCKGRRSSVINDSSNVKNAMKFDEAPPPEEENVVVRKPELTSSDKRFIRSTFDIANDDEVVWQPSYRVAYQLLMTKGVHDPRSEDNTLKTYRQKQNKMMSYKNTHWRSTVFTSLEPQERPYKYNDIIGGGPCGEPLLDPKTTNRFRQWRFHDVVDPIRGCELFKVKKDESGKHDAKPLPHHSKHSISLGRVHQLPHFTPLRFRSVVDPITGCVLFDVDKHKDRCPFSVSA